MFAKNLLHVECRLSKEILTAFAVERFPKRRRRRAGHDELVRCLNREVGVSAIALEDIEPGVRALAEAWL